MSEWINGLDQPPTEEDGYIWIWYSDIKMVSSPMKWDMFDPFYEGDELWMPTGLQEPEPPNDLK